MKQQGIILVSVLIFLFLLSLLALHGLSNSQLQTKISNNLLSQSQELQALEVGLNAGEKLIMTNQKNSCITNDITQLSPKPWLNKNYCTTQFAHLTVNYLDESLASSVCLIAGYTVNQEVILKMGDIYRVTSWTPNNGILQTTYAVATTDKCTNVSAKIWTGRLSWQEITNS